MSLGAYNKKHSVKSLRFSVRKTEKSGIYILEYHGNSTVTSQKDKILKKFESHTLHMVHSRNLTQRMFICKQNFLCESREFAYNQY